VVCSLAGNYAFFIHSRFPNIITEKMQWLTVGCGPIIKSESEDSAEKARVQVLKDAIFQPCLAILMHRFVPVSQYGEPMTVPGEEEPVLAVPRVVLYAADQPEERRVLGFKLRGCKRPCSHCLVGKHDAACRVPKAAVRDVLEHVDLQLDAAEALEDGAGQARMAQIEGGSSIVPIIPALAAALGLGTGPCCLYQIFRSFSFCRAPFLLASHPNADLALHLRLYLVQLQLVQVSCAQGCRSGDLEGATVATWCRCLGLHGCWSDWPSGTRFHRPVLCMPAAAAAPRRGSFCW